MWYSGLYAQNSFIHFIVLLCLTAQTSVYAKDASP